MLALLNCIKQCLTARPINFCSLFHAHCVHNNVFMAHILLFTQRHLSVLGMYYFVKARKAVLSYVNKQITVQL